MNISRNIQPLSTFKRETVKIIKQLKQTREPVVLTINGKAEIVVQDASAYQEFLEEHERMKERLETIVCISRGLEDVKQGRLIRAREYFKEFIAANEIPEED
jgi:prevent-host-death family protein